MTNLITLSGAFNSRTHEGTNHPAKTYLKRASNSDTTDCYASQDVSVSRMNEKSISTEITEKIVSLIDTAIKVVVIRSGLWFTAKYYETCKTRCMTGPYREIVSYNPS